MSIICLLRLSEILNLSLLISRWESERMIKTVRCHYQFLADYCNKIGKEHIISITSCYGEQYGEHFFTLVYDTPDLVLEDC